jgi:hypothetical protein
MDPKMRRVLAAMPPHLASEYIMKMMQPQTPAKGVVINGRLVNPMTGDVIADYSDQGNDTTFGLNPIFGQDADGNPVMLQLGNDGTARLADLPEGVVVDPAYKKYQEQLGAGLGENQADIETGGTAASAVEAGKNAQQAGFEAWQAAGQIRKSISNYDRAIAAIDAGGRTGAIDKLLPNITTESAELSNAMDTMGLDVVGAVTFGALSEGELKLAMETAVPRNLDEAELREWLVARKAAVQKTEAMLMDAALFLQDPGNTIKDWIERNTGEFTTELAVPDVAPDYLNEQDSGLWEYMTEDEKRAILKTYGGK